LYEDYLKPVRYEGVERIKLAENRVHWRIIVDVVVDLIVSLKRREFLNNVRDCRFPRKYSAAWNTLGNIMRQSVSQPASQSVSQSVILSTDRHLNRNPVNTAMAT
jgi:hypothetical protein